MSATIALICSVDLELEPLLRLIGDVSSVRVGTVPGHVGTIGGREVIALAGGMGKVNAASALTWAIATRRITGVIGFGVAGAYVGAGLQIGQVVAADSEVYGDEGVATPEGWISCEGIGIPLARTGGADFYNHFPCDLTGVERTLEALAASGRPAGRGRFVTVSQCSGTRARGDQLAARFGAVGESMEGAAYAHVAAVHGLPFLELRGISNLVEDRDLSRWRLREAAESAAAAAAVAVQAWELPRAAGSESAL